MVALLQLRLTPIEEELAEDQPRLPVGSYQQFVLRQAIEGAYKCALEKAGGNAADAYDQLHELQRRLNHRVNATQTIQRWTERARAPSELPRMIPPGHLTPRACVLVGPILHDPDPG